MAVSSADDVAWVDVLPSMANFAPALLKGLVGVGSRAGQQVSAEMTAALGLGGKQAGAAVAASLAAAQDKVTASTLALAKAKDSQETAEGRVRVAETSLIDIMNKDNVTATQLTAANERLAAARRTAATAADSTAVADSRVTAATTAQKDAQERATAAQSGGILSLKNIGLAAGAAAVIMGGKAISAAADFQQQMTRLTTTAGESTKNISMVGDGILKMSGEVGISAKDLANGMYTVESAGFDGADGLTVLKAAAEGARAENADLGTVANAVTDILTDYHLPASQAAQVTSQLTEAVSLGKTNFQELAGSMSSIAPIAAAAHIPLADMLGDIAQMTSHGVSAQQATQNLANAVRSLSNPTQTMTQELSQVGLRSDDLSRSLGKNGLYGTMDIITKAILEKMGPSGTILLSTFNQSKIAAEDANKMYQAMPPALQKVADGFNAGTVSMGQLRKGVAGLSGPQDALVRQWATLQVNAHGFTDALKNGSTTSQSFTQALAKATGNSTDLNVALLLAGENSQSTAQKIKQIADVTTEAGGNIKGWGQVQNNFNQQLAQTKDAIGAIVIKIGEALLPVATLLLRGLSALANLLLTVLSPVFNTLGAVLGGIASAFQNLGHWIQQNHEWLIPLAIVIGTVTLAMTAQTLAAGAASIATGIWGAVTATVTAVTGGLSTALIAVRLAILAVNTAFLANPIVAIIAAVVALVGAFIYLWNTSSGFRNFFIGLWRDIQSGVVTAFNAVKSAIGTAISAISGFFQQVGKVAATVWGAISTAVQAVGHWFQWLWSTVIQPVVNAISIAFRVLFAVVVTAVILPIELAIRGLAALAIWLYDAAIHPALLAIAAAWQWLYATVIKPVGDAIGAVFQWLYNNVVLPVRDGLTVAFNAIGQALSFVWTGIIQPTINAMGAIFQWLYNSIVAPIRDALIAAFNAIGQALSFVWSGIISPTINAIAAAWQWLYNNIVVPVRDALIAAFNAVGQALSFVWTGIISPAINAIGAAFNWLWNNAVLPVKNFLVAAFNDIGNFFSAMWNNVLRPTIDAIGNAFNTVVKAIGDVWRTLEDIFKAPINFLISVVYTHGIEWLWNHVVDAIGLHNLDLPDIKPLAAGGVIPGYTTKDVVPALLRRGEGVLTPEAVNLIGGPSFVYSLNKKAGGPAYNTSPVTHFATGGVAAKIESDGFAHYDVGGVIGNILSFIGNVAKDTIDIVTNPVQFVKDQLPKDAAGVVDVGANMAGTLIDKSGTFLWNKILDFFAAPAKSFANNVGNALAGREVSASLMAWILQAIAITHVNLDTWMKGLTTLIMRESGGNPGAINLTDSNAAAGHPSKGLMQTIDSTFQAYRDPSLPNNVFDPVANIVAGINYIKSRYGDITNVQQANSALPPKGYDNGGYLEPGYTMVYNGLGVPEPVFTPSQLSLLESGSQGGSFVLEGGTLAIAGDGLSAVVRGTLRKTSEAAARRLVAGHR